MTTITNTLNFPGTDRPQVGVTVSATLVPGTAFSTDGTIEYSGAVTATTDANGLWSLDLIQQSALTPSDSYYVVTEGPKRHTITVPDSGPANLHDVLTSPVASTGVVTGLTLAAADALYPRMTLAGQPNGYASLDGSGLVPADQLPASTGGGGIKAADIRTSVTGLADFSGAAGTGTWTLFPVALRATVSASAGDIVTYKVGILSTGADAEMDAAAVVAGNPVRYHSSGTATQKPNGHGELYISGDYGRERSQEITWVVQAGDLSAGSLTLAFLYRAGTGHTWTTAASTGDSTAYPASVSAINLGAPA